MDSRRLARLIRAVAAGDFDFEAPSRRTATGLALFLAGVGTGVLVGMLLAPSSGEELRSNLSERAREGFESARSKAQEFTSRQKPVANEPGARTEKSSAS